jgi:hypothetical protein
MMLLITNNSFTSYLASACTSTGEYIWQIVLAIILLFLGSILLILAAKDKRVFLVWIKKRESRYGTTALAVILFILGLLNLMSTIFGWTCPR